MSKAFVRCAVIVCLAAVLGGCMSTGFRKLYSGLNREDVLYDKRSYTQAYIASPDEVYDRVYDEIRKIGAAIYRRDDCGRLLVTYGYNTIYPGCIDTTEVGIVVRPTAAAGVTDVVVSSDNYIVAGRVAKDLFSRLAGKEMNVTIPDRPAEPMPGKKKK